MVTDVDDNGSARRDDSTGHARGGRTSSGGFGGRDIPPKERLAEIVSIVCKRWRLILILFLAVSIPAVLITFLRGPTYTASAKVLIVSPSDAGGVAAADVTAAIVNSEVHIIRSRELMEQVVRALAAAGSGDDPAVMREKSPQDEAIGRRVRQIARQLEVRPLRDSNVIEIAFASSNASQATRLVNRVIDEYIIYHSILLGDDELSSFFEEQARTLTHDVQHAEDLVQQFFRREGLVAPNTEAETTVREVADLEAALRRQKATIASTEERLRTVRAQLAEQPPRIKTTERRQVTPLVELLRKEVAARQIDRAILLDRYGEDNPTVQENSAELAALEARLREATREQHTIVTEEVFANNPVYEGRLTESLEIEAALSEERADEKSLQAALGRRRERLMWVRLKALEFTQLKQEVERLRAVRALYAQRQEEARIADAMDQEELVNIEVVERPMLPLPRADDRELPFVLAILSGLTVGFGGAFGAEYFSRSLRSERDVERFLDLQVVGTLEEKS